MRSHPALPRLFAALALAAGLVVFPVAAPGLSAKTVPFVFRDLDDRTVRLADYRGQWVLVAFWAPWCPLCKIQMPTLRQLDARPDVAVIGIGLDYDNPDSLRGTASKYDLPFPIVAGGSRRSPDSPHRQVGPVDYFPTSYLYDPSGEIAMYIPGQVDTNKVLAFMAKWQGGATTAPLAAGQADKLAAFLKRNYGSKGEQAYADWRRLVNRAASADLPGKLALVNDFFNRRMLQGSDQRVWGKADYWATPGEFLGKGIGDSEDFAIAKYFTLHALDVPVERLRLVYVKPQGSGDPVHMVLACFAGAERDPLLLDNRETALLPASKRPDLRPIFSFNSEGAWGDAQGLAELSGGRLPVWEDLLQRARNEGFN